MMNNNFSSSFILPTCTYQKLPSHCSNRNCRQSFHGIYQADFFILLLFSLGCFCCCAPAGKMMAQPPFISTSSFHFTCYTVLLMMLFLPTTVNANQPTDIRFFFLLTIYMAYDSSYRFAFIFVFFFW